MLSMLQFSKAFSCLVLLPSFYVAHRFHFENLGLMVCMFNARLGTWHNTCTDSTGEFFRAETDFLCSCPAIIVFQLLESSLAYLIGAAVGTCLPAGRQSFHYGNPECVCQHKSMWVCYKKTGKKLDFTFFSTYSYFRQFCFPFPSLLSLQLLSFCVCARAVNQHNITKREINNVILILFYNQMYSTF